jgi:hypothetical protein
MDAMRGSIQAAVAGLRRDPRGVKVYIEAIILFGEVLEAHRKSVLMVDKISETPQADGE